MIEQFQSILNNENEEDLIQFLKSLNDADKRQLGPVIKKLSRDYNDYSRADNGNVKYGGTEKQREMVLLASFVCHNLADFETSRYPIWMLDWDRLSKVISWYCPRWFNDFVNKQAGLEFYPEYFTYDLVMELHEMGHVNPTKELLVFVMTNMIFPETKRNRTFKPENLLNRAVTLEKHIWYFFEFDSNIHYAERFLHFEANISKADIGWIQALKMYCDKGKIDRKRLLKESLLASNKNFHKVLSGWFIDLFLALEPTKAEALVLQKELLSVLTSKHSKPINTALNYFKKIIDEKEFDHRAFLDQCPILLTSETKSVVLSALQLLEKLGNKKELQNSISRLAAQAFVHSDEQIQTKAATIINALMESFDNSFIEELRPFESGLLSNAKNILSRFLKASEEAASPVTKNVKEKTAKSEELKPVRSIETIDDLIFFASQALENNNSLDIDLLPAAFIKFFPALKGKEADRLEPALQRALKLTQGQFRSINGRFDLLLATFMIDVCVELVRKHSADSTQLTKIFEKFTQHKGNQTDYWLDIDKNTSYLLEWKKHFEEPLYQPHWELLQIALQKIRQGDVIPLLSTPTHEPAWVSATELVKRISVYNKAGMQPATVDFDIAIMRCINEGKNNISSIVETLLEGEQKNIMQFLLGEVDSPKEPYYNPRLWITASISRKEKKVHPEFEERGFYQKPFFVYTGQYEWESKNEKYESKEYDSKSGKYVKRTSNRQLLRIHLSKNEQEERKKFVAKRNRFLDKELEPSVVEFLALTQTFLSVEQNDIRRALMLAPNNPDPLLAHILDNCLRYPEFWEESAKKAVIATIQALFEIWRDMGNMAHVFLATCFLSSDKTVANIAAEIWLKGVIDGRINNSQLGKAIGLHERIEFAPLKRFTDLATQRLFRVSAQQNEALEELIGYILVELPDEPIKNLKKLLELYRELLVTNESKVTDEKIKDRLLVWRNNSGLKKLVEGIA